MMFCRHKEESSDTIPFHWQGEPREKGDDDENEDDKTRAENGKLSKQNISNACEKYQPSKDEMEDSRTCERDCASFFNSSSNPYKNSRKSMRNSVSQSPSNAGLTINGIH